jgi:8-oxo-dGTP pyrophosphatase MutT (NUDIX family)
VPDILSVWTIGVFGVISDDQGRILLVRAKGREKWSLPGGGVSKRDILRIREEGIEEERMVLYFALFRELKEEVGLHTKDIISYLEWELFPSCKLKDLAVVFFVRVKDAAIKKLAPSHEIKEVKFVSQQELKKLPLVGKRMRKMIDWGFSMIAPS